MLALFAGKQPGFMEDYDIIRLNTSGLGRNLIPTPAQGGDKPTTTTSGGSGLGGFFGSVVASVTAAAGAVESKIAGVADDIADELLDKLSQELGIKQFYSLHALDTCEGDFTPNATTIGAGFNVTNCTAPLDTGKYNVTARLDHDLGVGPLKINLASLKWSQDLQHEFDKIPGLFLALAIFFIIGAGAAGVSMLSSIAGLVTYSRSPRLTALNNVCWAGLSALALFVGSMIVTIGGKKAADAINEFGDDIGLVATRGSKFISISWASFAAMFVAACYWTYELFAVIKARRRGHSHNKYMDRQSMEERSAR